MKNHRVSISLSIIKLFSGRAVIQIFNFLTVPILARLFLPDHFGVIQIFDSISKVLIVISCLRYELSIPLGRDTREALASLVTSLLIALIVSSLVLVGVSVGRSYIATWFEVSELQTFLWLLPLVVLAGGMNSALGFWAAREGRFGTIAWSDLGNSVAEKLIPISWGIFIGASVTGLFTGRLIGVGGGVGVLLFLLGKKLLYELKQTTLSFKMLWGVAKHHKKFPIFNAWTVFLNSISVQLPPLFLGAYFSPAIVGYYALGYKAISLPMTMLRNSIAKVFFPVAAKEYNEFGTLTTIVMTFFTRLVQIGVFPMAVLSIAGPFLFVQVFGQQWHEAGIYARMLAVWYCMAFLNAPLKIFVILNRQELNLLINLLILVARGISLFIGVTFASPRMALGIFVIVSVCSLLVSIIWQLKLAHVSVWWASRTLTTYIGISSLLLFPVKLVTWFTSDSKYVFIILSFAIVSYGIVLFRIDHSFRQFIGTRWGELKGNWGKTA